MWVLVAPALRSRRQPLEVFEDVRATLANLGDRIAEQIPIKIDVVPFGLKIDVLVVEAVATNEPT